MAEKVSLSLDADLLAQARKLAGARSLSALVNDGLRIKLQHERLAVLLAEMNDEFGAPPRELVEEARRIWPDRTGGTR